MIATHSVSGSSVLIHIDRTTSPYESSTDMLFLGFLSRSQMKLRRGRNVKFWLTDTSIVLSKDINGGRPFYPPISTNIFFYLHQTPRTALLSQLLKLLTIAHV